ncbi:outer membrane protein [Bradyrhizobium sp.]|uniref:outer membrane protein n=1 Tax=Bradyrhizobium sp. TaxID=376 RepID=UPI003C730D69
MRNLKFIVSAAVVGALVGITAATAADLPARTYTKAPVYVEPAFNWSGFYVGGNIGYSWGRSGNTAEISDLATGVILDTATSRNDVNGVIGGAQFGYNWQISNWVAGFEADVQGSGERGSTAFTCVACGNGGGDITSTLTQKLSWFGTVRGRAGVLVTPTILLYGTGGLAYGEIDTGGSITGGTLQGPLNTVLFPGLNSTQVGWAAGAGIEGRISGNWTMKLEYLYMDLGTVSAGPIATNILVPPRTNAGASYSSHFTDNILRVGFNYLLNAPVVAKY